MYGDKIERLSMEEIESGKNAVLNHLSKKEKAKLNQAFVDLQTGKISRIEYARILQYALSRSIEQGIVSKGFKTNLWKYLDENKFEIGKDLARDTAVASVEQAGLTLLKKSIEKSDDAVIMKGPEGQNQWAIVERDKVETAGHFNKAGQVLIWTGKIGGPALSVFGLHQGYKNDIEDGKTPGEAVAHTGGSFLAGVGGSGLMTLAMTGSFFGPVGWVGAGVAIVAGVGASSLFNFAYNNSEKFRSGVDWTGEKIDEGISWATNKMGEGAQWLAGEIVNSSVYKKINSEKNNVKQKAGEAVKQVIGGAVNHGKKKLNDIKRGVGEALKDKMFRPKLPRMNWG